MKYAIPYPKPLDSEELATIHKFIEYVLRNGEIFELKIKEKERDNPKFNFLFSSKNEAGNGYYQWILFCKQNLLTEDNILWIENHYRHLMSTCLPGTIDLTFDDRAILVSLLAQNNGSKESIKSIRKWILARAHSFSSIVQVVAEILRQESTESNSFSKFLHTIYVLNDVLFNGSDASTQGVYTRCLDSFLRVPLVDLILPYLPWILQRTYRCAQIAAESQRTLTMLTLWESKGFLSADTRVTLQESICRPEEVPFPARSPLVSPYPDLSSLRPGLPAPPLHTPPPLPPSQLLSSSSSSSVSSGGAWFGNQPVDSTQPSAPPVLTTPPLLQTPTHFNDLSSRANFPPSLGSYPTSIPLVPLFDLDKCSVGTLANIAKAAVRSGHPKYAPIGAHTLYAQAIPPHIEPARLEARLAEFYRKLESL